jgi:hypothetical protein
MDYLGDIGKVSIDYFNVPGRGKVVKGVQKWNVPCNWKFAVDNIWDWYHVTITHSSSGMSGATPGGVQRWSPSKKVQPELVALGKYGHAIGGAARGEADENRGIPTYPEQDKLGPVGSKMAGFGGIFPNLWVTREGLILRVPNGPLSTQMWRLPTMPADPTPEERQRGITRTIRSQGPAGTFEVDDAENWGLSTVGTMGTVIRRYPLNYQMSLGHGRVTIEEGGPPFVASNNWTEHGQRWHYQNWAVWMSAVDWSEIESNHPRVPLETV